MIILAFIVFIQTSSISSLGNELVRIVVPKWLKVAFTISLIIQGILLVTLKYLKTINQITFIMIYVLMALYIAYLAFKSY